MFKKMFDQSNKPKAICPHCENEIDNALTRFITFGARMHYCPICRKVLGFSDTD